MQPPVLITIFVYLSNSRGVPRWRRVQTIITLLCSLLSFYQLLYVQPPWMGAGWEIILIAAALKKPYLHFLIPATTYLDDDGHFTRQFASA
jgi:hypothetical protein